MLNTIKTKTTEALRKAANSRASVQFRNMVGIRPVPFVNPGGSYTSSEYAVSDLFIWRADAKWKTYFDLVNLSSMAFPHVQTAEEIELILMDSQGTLKRREHFLLAHHEIRKICLSEIAKGLGEFGCFAAFHKPEKLEHLKSSESCLVERGYVSFQQTQHNENPSLSSYVHGNVYVLAQKFGSDSIEPIRRPVNASYTYHPQVILDDCNFAELFYLNQSPREERIEVRFFDETEELDTQEIKLPAYGSYRICTKSFAKPPQRVQSTTKMPLCRPLIMKHYDSHFDVFHS